MSRSRLRTFALDQVHVRREGDCAHLTPADGAGGVVFKVGADRMAAMTDAEVVELYNGGVEATIEHIAANPWVAREIPSGKPQIQWLPDFHAWTTRGHVLCCLIDEEEDDPQMARVEIDGQSLSMEEFGRLLSTYVGWGMRIVFVPDDELEVEPIIEIADQTDEGGE